MGIHNTAAIIFLVSVVIHIMKNWKSMKQYMKSKAGEYFTFKKELIIAAVVVIMLFGIIAFHPFFLG